MDKRKAADLGLIITLISFLGFCVENIWLAITSGYMNNRNMILPLLFGYGLAIVAIYLILGTPGEPKLFGRRLRIKNGAVKTAAYLILAGVCVSLGEIILGTAVEELCGLVWWDYTSLPLNITKYTSVPTAVMFGVLITFFMGRVIGPLYELFDRVSLKAAFAVSSVFMILMSADFIHSAVRMLSTGEIMQIWKIVL